MEKTIGQTARHYGVSPDAFKKALNRALQSHKYAAVKLASGIPESLTAVGMRDIFTPELLSFWASVKNKDVPDLIQAKPDKKSEANQPPAPKSDKQNPPKPSNTSDRTILDGVFATDAVVLLAVFLLICSDGYCTGILAGRAINSDAAFLIFTVIGVIVGYAAVRNAYVLTRKTRKVFETDYTPVWIGVFSVFQYLLHGAAFDLFSGWAALDMSEIIGRNLLCIATPIATAALSVTLFKKRVE